MEITTWIANILGNEAQQWLRAELSKSKRAKEIRSWNINNNKKKNNYKEEVPLHIDTMNSLTIWNRLPRASAPQEIKECVKGMIKKKQKK